jgi:outer membrane protein assembly factor BamE (lipoprotein component of BamABCDE complex)
MGTRIRYDTFFSNRPNPSGFLAMRHFLISALLLTWLPAARAQNRTTASMQQQRARPESVARLKPGLSRSQVRLPTLLVVDPFRNDR